jgi:hypothetical protein
VFYCAVAIQKWLLPRNQLFITMKLLITLDELADYNSEDLIPCECLSCQNTFYRSKKLIVHELKHSRGRNKFCNQKCVHSNQKSTENDNVVCVNCGQPFIKHPSYIKQTPNHFCTKSCAATYHNTHKTTGNRRSKLESYLESQLIILYPTLEIHYNRKDAINSELDIYIPSLTLAVELNGIFHYEPIYGADKLAQIQNNDQRKFQACLERGIELCIIDASNLTYFKPTRTKQYLDIICNLINNKSKNINFCSE